MMFIRSPSIYMIHDLVSSSMDVLTDHCNYLVRPVYLNPYRYFLPGSVSVVEQEVEIPSAGGDSAFLPSISNEDRVALQGRKCVQKKLLQGLRINRLLSISISSHFQGLDHVKYKGDFKESRSTSLENHLKEDCLNVLRTEV